MPEISEKVLEKLNKGREFRRIDLSSVEIRSENEGQLIVEGYACTFEPPYELFRDDGYIVMEQIDSRAFEDCDMSDVIFQYNHSGRVAARTRNNTLQLTVDAHGLHIRADLSGTELGRQLYEEIKGGYTDKMSFSFVVGEDVRTVTDNRENHVTTVFRTITKFTKLYDVSAVSFPANEATEISARQYSEGVITGLKELEQLRAEDNQKRERQREEIRRLLGKQKGEV